MCIYKAYQILLLNIPFRFYPPACLKGCLNKMFNIVNTIFSYEIVIDRLLISAVFSSRERKQLVVNSQCTNCVFTLWGRYDITKQLCTRLPLTCLCLVKQITMVNIPLVITSFCMSKLFKFIQDHVQFKVLHNHTFTILSSM